MPTPRKLPALPVFKLRSFTHKVQLRFGASAPFSMVDFNRLSRIHGRQSIKLLGGVSAVFHPSVGSSVSCAVLLTENIQLISDDGMRTESATTIDVSVEQVPVVNKNDRFAVSESEYVVKEELENDGHVIKLKVI